MTRHLRSLTKLELCAAALIAWTSPVRAQSFVEFAGGSNFVHARTPQAGSIYGHGFTVRGSYGYRVNPGISLRFDGDYTQFDNQIRVYPPCPFPGCTHAYYEPESNFLGGLTLNAVANLDRRGLAYVIAGGGPGFHDEPSYQWHLRAQAGVGLAIPTGERLRVVAEARWVGLVGGSLNTSWLIPLTLGIRY